MKIIRLIARLNVGGPARHVVWLTSRMQNSEFQSVLIAGTVPDGEEDMSYFADQNGVDPIYIPELSRELSSKDIISLFRIWREFRRHRPDIIHTHTAKAGTIGRIAAWLYRWFTPSTLIGRPRKTKVVHTFHGHVFHSYYGRAKTRFFLMVERLLARFATDKIIVITDQQFREINGEFAIGSPKQFEVIPLGIDLEKLSLKSGSIRREINADDGEIMVGFIGRLTEIKNIPLLLDTFALHEKGTSVDGPKMKLAIVGDGHLRAELEAHSKNQGMTDVVHFLGNRENVAELVSGMDIVALTSKNEGTPLSLIEAMAAGKPVISTAVGGVVDLVGAEREQLDGFSVCERGVLVKSKNADDFLNGLIYLAKNEKLRQSIATEGRIFANEKYSIDRLESDIASLYRRLVSEDKNA